MKKMISVLLFISMALACIVPLSASEIKPYYEGVTSGAAALSISNFGIATCTTAFDLRYALVEADIEMQLLRFEASGWEEVKTWEEHYGASEKRSLVLNKLYAVADGIYKVYVIADIETTAGSDHLEMGSNIEEYP